MHKTLFMHSIISINKHYRFLRLFLPHREYGYQMIARFRLGNMNASPIPSTKVYPDYFRRKVLHMVSRHQKQQYIEPVLASRLGFICKTVSEVDTDLLGTFSGEVARTLSPVACAREKCKRAREYVNDGYLLASEGSFGPHPTLGWVTAGEEWLLLYDIEEDAELIVRDITLDTCFLGKAIANEQQCLEFLQRVGFPNQGVIVKSSQEQSEIIFKNGSTPEEIVKNMHNMLNEKGNCYIETDMRAMFNPTRQQHLNKLAGLLADKLNSICPDCGWYGFSVTSVERGLPCSWCGTPTNSVSNEIYTCKRCNYHQNKKFPKGIQQEDPQYCNQCNP